MTTYDELLAKLDDVDPRQRHDAKWVMNRDHFRELWVMAMPDHDPDGYDVGDDQTRIEKALAAPDGNMLLGHPIVVDPAASEIQVRVPERPTVIVPEVLG